MIRRFFKDSAIYVIPSLLSRGIGFFLLPIYTRYLSPGDYGVLEFYAVFYAILNLTLPLEISQAVARLLPDAKGHQKSLYASTAFWFTAAGFSLFTIVVWLFPEKMSQLVLGSDTLVDEVCIGALAMISSALFYLLQNQLRFISQPKAYAVTSIMFSIITSIVTVTLIVGYGMGVKGFMWGQLAGGTIAVLAAIYCVKSTVPILFKVEASSLKAMLVFSAPLVLSGIAVYFTLFADRWALRKFLGMDEVGIYSVAYRVATIVSLVILAFQMSLTPLVYQHYKETETPQTIGDILCYFLILVLPLILFIGIFSPEIVSLISTPEFHAAALLIPWLALSVVLMNIYVFSPGLGIAKKTHVVALINVIAAVVNVLLNLMWVPKFGMIGAAWATLCGAVVMASMYFWLGNREYTVSYRKWRNILAVILTSSLMFLVVTLPFTLQERGLIWFIASLITTGLLMTMNDRKKAGLFLRLMLRSK